MRHLHFGAGNFGLGFVVPLFVKAGAKTLVVNRASPKTGGDAPSMGKNELLLRDQRYFLKYLNLSISQDSPDAVEEIRFDQFSVLDDESGYRDIIDFAIDRELLTITTSIKSLSNAAEVIACINEILIQRMKAKSRTFLVAMENGFSTSDLLEKLDQPVQTSRYCVAVESSVDRICANMTQHQLHTGVAVLGVEVEKYARLVLQQSNATKDLAKFLAPLGDTLVFTDRLAAYTMAKINVLNAGHLFIASDAHFYGIDHVDFFLAEHDVTRDTPPVEARRSFASGILHELVAGTRAAARYEYPNDIGFHELIDELTNDDAVEGIIARFSDVHDPVARVIARLKAPSTEDIETMSDFLGSFYRKVSKPVEAFVKSTGYGPPRITLSFLRIAALIARREYINKAKTRH
ncbi:hypothetical protein [Bradyrhizobium pachyrhizi]|uniref:hypothetical protein n=1 Tax=Bradyrhizobium pachyrhizi TaxID=280333 RepID=UPI00067AFC75|nr:hypothetical protein [Bradyrhizobium pachyrhizi]